MSRSVWKGPFVEQSLIKKVDKQKDNPGKNCFPRRNNDSRGNEKICT